MVVPFVAGRPGKALVCEKVILSPAFPPNGAGTMTVARASLMASGHPPTFALMTVDMNVGPAGFGLIHSRRFRLLLDLTVKNRTRLKGEAIGVVTLVALFERSGSPTAEVTLAWLTAEPPAIAFTVTVR